MFTKFPYVVHGVSEISSSKFFIKIKSPSLQKELNQNTSAILVGHVDLTVGHALLLWI